MPIAVTAETSLHEIIRARKRKIERLREMGVNPYPYRFTRTHTTVKVAEQFQDIAPGEKADVMVSLAGRIMRSRGQGSLTFADLQDQEGKLQLFFQRGVLSEDAYLMLDLLDLGDYSGVQGSPCRTKRGELSLRVTEFQILAKTLRPLPEKWHGIRDSELIYRLRSEYFLTDSDAREIIRRRARAVRVVRDVLDQEDFLEVDIPTLQPVYGGASAKPFETYVNALDRKFYLSISPELYLKRLLAGGFERVYTICKNFRNEGIDKSHNPEFTMMECYAA